MDNKTYNKEQEWTMRLMNNVMQQTGMDEAELCRKAMQDSDWLTRLKNGKEEATLQDCFALAASLKMDLHEFFIQFDPEGSNVKGDIK